MFLYELLDEERKEAAEFIRLSDAVNRACEMRDKGYPETTIKRQYCGYPNLTALSEAMTSQANKVASVQDRIRRFMLDGGNKQFINQCLQESE